MCHLFIRKKRKNVEKKKEKFANCKMVFISIIDAVWISCGFFIVFLILLSALNKSIGVRRFYVQLLLRIFEVNNQQKNKNVPQFKKKMRMLMKVAD